MENQHIEDAAHAENQCVQCPFLSKKVVDLQKEILNLKTQHDIEIQRLQLKIDKLENYKKEKIDQVKQFRKELLHEKNQTIRLNDVISELKSRNFISDEDGKLLNVSLICFYIAD